MEDKLFEGRSVIVLYDEERVMLSDIINTYPRGKMMRDLSYDNLSKRLLDKLSKNDVGFNRKELLRIRNKAEIAIGNSNNPHWKRCYEDIAASCDHLDAMIARHEVDIEDGFMGDEERMKKINK